MHDDRADLDEHEADRRERGEDRGDDRGDTGRERQDHREGAQSLDARRYHLSSH